MTIAYWCVLIAALLPYLWAVLSKTDGAYDHAKPRIQKKDGWRLRAEWAQANSWEAFAPFGIAIIIAHLLHASQTSINRLAVAFIAARLVHGVAYIGNWPAIRSVAWATGLLCVIGLFLIAA